LEANARYDGSSKFMPGNKWDFFWGALAGWRISEESFIKDNANWINNLKLRLSFAKLGDDSLNFYNYLGGYNYPGAVNNSHNGYPGGYFFNGVFINSLSTRDTPNPGIGWIKIYSANIGLDAEFWNGKLGFSVDFFQRSRDGLVARRGAILPNTFGAGVAEENLNGDRTSGYEVQVSHRNRVGEFFYELDANMSYTRTLRTARPAQAIRQSSRAYWRDNEENRYGDIMFGIGDWGRYGSYDEIFNDYYANGDVLPGDYRYEDWNDDGVIDEDDRHPIALTNPGNSFGQRRGPLMFFALNTRFGWKGIDLDLNFQGATMAWAGYGEAISQPLLWNGNALDYHMDRWRPVDPKADPYNPSTEWQSGRWSYGANKALPRDNSRAGIQNGTYLRLKTITLGYTLPAQITSKAGIDNLRLYVSGYNMLTFTGMEGLDPEKPGDQAGYTYPLNKTVSFGASLKF
jgi:hypothetical protein